MLAKSKVVAGLAVLLTVAVLIAHGSAWAQKMPKPKAPKPTSSAQETALPEAPLTAEQADQLMAGLTDAQARKMLAQALKRPSAAAEDGSEEKTPGGRAIDPIGAIVHKLETNIAALAKKIAGLFSETEEEAVQWQGVLRQLAGERSPGRIFLTVLALAAIIGAGLLQRWLFFKSVRRLHDRLASNVRLGRFEFFGRVVSNLFLEAAGALVYIVTALILFILFYDPGEPGYPLVSSFLTVSYYVILMTLAGKIIFAPGAPGLRLAPMLDQDANFLYRWLVILTLGAGFFGGAGGTIRLLGAGQQIFLLVVSLAGVFITVALLVMIWKSRERVAAALQPADLEAGGAGLRNLLARNWHWLAGLYVLFMGIYWVNDVLQGGNATIVNLLISLFVIPLFAGLDQWGQKILKFASAEGAEVHDLSGDAVREIKPFQGRTDIKVYAPLIRRLFRVVLAAFLFFAVMRLWGLDLEVGRIFTSHVMSVVMTLALGFVAWEFVKARIDKKLREEMPVTDDDHEEGGAGGSRTGTLLILLRKFIATVLFVIISLIVLSSMGINIGPLIAGAGVVGLAIGFGAQTLVKDIIAGVFFLIDDAFRVGDYVEAGAAKGGVEQISLRSIRLRHPRGMVYTIPFGDLKTVTNYSRDYTITKLDIRVRFDTDLEQVRKIVKRINKALRKDTEINRVMLDDLKSQGVKEFDDSAMIVRVKFKTLPGEQFAMKKEVYRLIQEEFRASGIEFAHRNVTVYLPPEPGQGGPQMAAAGAAAAAAMAQAEAEALAKAAPKKKE